MSGAGVGIAGTHCTVPGRAGTGASVVIMLIHAISSVNVLTEDRHNAC